MRIHPITLKTANAFVKEHHRHSNPTVGCKFAIGLYQEECLIGVAICGRPVSRMLDDGITLEINRVCTDVTFNACSMLYGASCRIAKEMGYKKVITYTLVSETGSSLKASNFTCDGIAGAVHWRGKRVKQNQAVPNELKIRWHRLLCGKEWHEASEMVQKVRMQDQCCDGQQDS